MSTNIEKKEQKLLRSYEKSIAHKKKEIDSAFDFVEDQQRIILNAQTAISDTHKRIKQLSEEKEELVKDYTKQMALIEEKDQD